MLKIGPYMVIESKEEFDKNYNSRWERLCGDSFQCDPEKNVYPLYLRYCESWDPRCCGDYVLTEKSAVEEHLQSMIKSYQDLLNNLP